MEIKRGCYREWAVTPVMGKVNSTGLSFLSRAIFILRVEAKKRGRERAKKNML